MAKRIPERVWRELCGSLENLKQVFSLAALMFVLMAVWFPFTAPGTATYVVVVMNLVAALGIIAVTAPFIYLCGRRRQRDHEAAMGER